MVIVVLTSYERCLSVPCWLAFAIFPVLGNSRLWFMVRPGSINSLWTIPRLSKKASITYDLFTLSRPFFMPSKHLGTIKSTIIMQSYNFSVRFQICFGYYIAMRCSLFRLTIFVTSITNIYSARQNSWTIQAREMANISMERGRIPGEGKGNFKLEIYLIVTPRILKDLHNQSVEKLN